MRLYAYSLYGPQPHLAWSDVDTWLVSGPLLTIWRDKTPETITLPAGVVGLHDDGPHTPAPPSKYDTSKKREEYADGSGEAEWDTPQRRYGRQRAGRPGK